MKILRFFRLREKMTTTKKNTDRIEIHVWDENLKGIIIIILICILQELYLPISEEMVFFLFYLLLPNIQHTHLLCMCVHIMSVSLYKIEIWIKWADTFISSLPLSTTYFSKISALFKFLSLFSRLIYSLHFLSARIPKTNKKNHRNVPQFLFELVHWII